MRVSELIAIKLADVDSTAAKSESTRATVARTESFRSRQRSKKPLPRATIAFGNVARHINIAIARQAPLSCVRRCRGRFCMTAAHDHLGDHILAAASQRGWDPYTKPFRPSDLGIAASDYGSFSGWCPDARHGGSASGKWNKHVCLRIHSRSVAGSPVRYLLLPREQWLYP
jgi:hypothetical protein